MGKIGFTAELKQGEAMTEDHAVYNQERYTVTERYGQITASDLGRLVILDYADGTGEIVKLAKVTHYRNQVGSRDRGASEYPDDEPLTQLIVMRNGDGRSLIVKSSDRVTFK